MSSVSRNDSGSNLFTLNNLHTVCCGRQLQTKDTRKLDALVLYKAIYVFCDYFVDEATALPAISAWYKIAKNDHTGLCLAINTSNIGLTTEDLNLFSNFSVLTQQIDIAREEVLAEKLFLASIRKNIQGYLLLKSPDAAMLASRLEQKEVLLLTSILEGESRNTKLESILRYTELRRFTVLEAIAQTIRSKKIPTSSQKFLVCNAACLVKDWIKKCNSFNLPVVSLKTSLSSFTSATVMTSLQDGTISIETDLEVAPTEVTTHMKDSHSSTSPPSSPIYPTNSPLLVEDQPSPIDEVPEFFSFLSNPCSSLSSSSLSEDVDGGDADAHVVHSVIQDISNPSCCKKCSACRKIKAEVVMDPIKDCFVLGVAFSCMDELPISLLEGMPVCLVCYNKAVSFLIEYYKTNYKSKSLLVKTMKTFKGDFIWNNFLTQHMNSYSITKEIDFFLRRRLLIVGSISLKDAFKYLSDSISFTTVPMRTLLVLFQKWAKHAQDVVFVASSEVVTGHSDSINYTDGKLVNMGPQAADFNPSCYGLQTSVDDTERRHVCITEATSLIFEDIITYVEDSSDLYSRDLPAFNTIKHQQVVEDIVPKYENLHHLVNAIQKISQKENKALSTKDRFLPMVTLLHCFCKLLYDKSKRSRNLYMQDVIGFALPTLSTKYLYYVLDGIGMTRSRSVTDNHMKAYCLGQQVHGDYLEAGQLIPVYDQCIWIYAHLDKPGVTVGRNNHLVALRFPCIQGDNNERKHYSEMKTTQQVLSETLVILYRHSAFFTLPELRIIVFELDGVLFPLGVVKKAHSSLKYNRHQNESCFVSASDRLEKSKPYEDEILSTCIKENADIHFGNKKKEDRVLTRDIIRGAANRNQTAGHDTDVVIPIKLFSNKCSTAAELSPTLYSILESMTSFWSGTRGNAVIFGFDGQVYEIAGTMITKSSPEDNLNAMLLNLGSWHACGQTAAGQIDKLFPDYMRESACTMGNSDISRELYAKWHAQDNNIQGSFEHKMSLLIPYFINWMQEVQLNPLHPESDFLDPIVVSLFREFLIFLNDPQLENLILSSTRYLYGMDGIRCNHNGKKHAAMLMMELLCYKSNCYNYASYYMQFQAILHQLHPLAKRVMLSMLTVSTKEGVAGRSLGNCECLETWQKKVKGNFPNTSTANINLKMVGLPFLSECKDELSRMITPDPVQEGSSLKIFKHYY